MEPGTQNELPGTRPVSGKKDKSGQPMTPDALQLKTRIPNLVVLHKKLKAAKEALQDAITASATASGLLASEVSAYVRAASGDDEAYQAAKLKASQRSMIFDELDSSRGETKQ